jgi:hypothetical protein
MNDIIKQKVLARNWTFNEIAELKNTIETLSLEIYGEMKLIERFDLVREIRMNENFVGHAFEDVMRESVMATLKADVAGIIREMLDDATVNFGGNKNEISERSMGGKPHKERTTDEKNDSKKQ